MLQDGWQALFAPHILRRGKGLLADAISPAKRHAGRDQEASKARPAAQYGQLVVYHLNLRKKPSGFGRLSEKPEGVFYPVVHAAAPCG